MALQDYTNRTPLSQILWEKLYFCWIMPFFCCCFTISILFNVILKIWRPTHLLILGYNMNIEKKNPYNKVLYRWVGPNGFSAKRHTLPPKSLHIPISVYVVKDKGRAEVGGVFNKSIKYIWANLWKIPIKWSFLANCQTLTKKKLHYASEKYC